MLATNMETKLRGFYINSGLLKFEEVQISEEERSSDSDVQTVKKRKQVRRVIEAKMGISLSRSI